MKVTHVTVSRTVKVNIKNYENTDIGVILAAEVEDGEDFTAVHNTLTQLTRDFIRHEIDSVEINARNTQSKAARFGV